jgi:hypothetical protein
MYKEHNPNYVRKEEALTRINHTDNNKNGTHI